VAHPRTLPFRIGNQLANSTAHELPSGSVEMLGKFFKHRAIYRCSGSDFWYQRRWLTVEGPCDLHEKVERDSLAACL
jgi:hypothetical protein